MAAYLNRIATAVPGHDVHEPFVQFAETLLTDRRSQVLFRRMAERSQIEHRFSTVQPRPFGSNAGLDTDDFYVRGAFPSTAQRMQRFEDKAPALALKAARGLRLSDQEKDAVTHVIVTTCTGFSAPGLDLQIVEGLGLKPQTERTIVGFMGCYAGISALKLARHIVRSEPESKVLVVSLELCTLHLQETSDLEQVLTFLVFGDGCAAALVSSEPSGLELESFHAELVPAAAEQITWTIRDAGFDMFLSGQVPGSIRHALGESQDRILSGCGRGGLRPVGHPPRRPHGARCGGSRFPLAARKAMAASREGRCASSATCPRPRCCSYSRPCSTSPARKAREAAPWPSHRA